MRKWILALLLLVLTTAPGCQCLNWVLYVFAPPEPQKTVDAEFDGFPKRSVAVLIYADLDVLYEFPYVRTELATSIQNELGQKVKDVRLVDPGRVVRYQDANLDWESAPIQNVGKALNADYVLYVSLGEYATRELGSTSLARGRISAQVSVWDSRPEPGADPCLWRKDNISVVWPEDQPLGVLAESDYALRMHTQAVFAQKLAKFFYEHKVPKES